MTTRYEQFPNDATLVAFHVLAGWGWSVEQIATATDTDPDRVRDILQDSTLQAKYATLQRLRARNARRMAARGIHVETVIWEPRPAPRSRRAVPSSGKSGEKVRR